MENKTPKNRQVIRISRNALYDIWNKYDYLEVNLVTGEYSGVDKEEA